MAERTLVLGSETCCADNKGPGEVRSVVIDRNKREVTHLVVEPKGRVGLARLVPMNHVERPAGHGLARLHRGGVQESRSR